MPPTELPADVLRSRIADATRLLREAEQDMERVVGQLSPVMIGDKRMSTDALDQSFRKLKAAHKLVADLEALLAALPASLPIR